MKYIWNKEVFEKVTSGEWTFEQFEAWVQDLAFEQFEAWVQDLESSRYDHGYTDGWDDAREDSVNDRSGE